MINIHFTRQCLVEDWKVHLSTWLYNLNIFAPDDKSLDICVIRPLNWWGTDGVFWFTINLRPQCKDLRLLYLERFNATISNSVTTSDKKMSFCCKQGFYPQSHSFSWSDSFTTPRTGFDSYLRVNSSFNVDTTNSIYLVKCISCKLFGDVVKVNMVYT